MLDSRAKIKISYVQRLIKEANNRSLSIKKGFKGFLFDSQRDDISKVIVKRSFAQNATGWKKFDKGAFEIRVT